MSRLEIPESDINSIIRTIFKYTQVTVTSDEAVEIWKMYSDLKREDLSYLPKESPDIWKCLSTIDLSNYIGWTSAEIIYK